MHSVFFLKPFVRAKSNAFGRMSVEGNFTMGKKNRNDFMIGVF